MKAIFFLIIIFMMSLLTIPALGQTQAEIDSLRQWLNAKWEDNPQAPATIDDLLNMKVIIEYDQAQLSQTQSDKASSDSAMTKLIDERVKKVGDTRYANMEGTIKLKKGKKLAITTIKEAINDVSCRVEDLERTADRHDEDLANLATITLHTRDSINALRDETNRQFQQTAIDVGVISRDMQTVQVRLEDVELAVSDQDKLGCQLGDNAVALKKGAENRILENIARWYKERKETITQCKK